MQRIAKALIATVLAVTSISPLRSSAASDEYDHGPYECLLSTKNLNSLVRGATESRRQTWTPSIPDRRNLMRAWTTYSGMMQTVRARKDVPAELRGERVWMKALVDGFKANQPWCKENLSAAMKQRSELIRFAGLPAVTEVEASYILDEAKKKLEESKSASDSAVDKSGKRPQKFRIYVKPDSDPPS